MCLPAHLFKGSVVLTWGKILRMFLFLLLKGIFSDNFLFSFVQGIKSSKCRLEIDGMYLFAMICDCKKSKAMNCGQYANHDSCETKKFFFHYPWYMTIKCFFFFVNNDLLVKNLQSLQSLGAPNGFLTWSYLQWIHHIYRTFFTFFIQKDMPIEKRKHNL